MGPVERGSEAQVEAAVDREQPGFCRLARIHCLLLYRSSKTTIDHQSGNVRITFARKTDRELDQPWASCGYPELG